MKAILVVAAMAVMAVQVRAQSIYPLPAETKADIGANYLAVIKYSDLSASTSTNTALVLSNFTVAAKTQVEVVLAKLVTAFDTGNTNFTGSCALTVGDGTDADLYLTSTELAGDGTEVWLKGGRSSWQTQTSLNAVTNVAPLYMTLTNEVALYMTLTNLTTGDAVTNVYQMATGSVSSVFTVCTNVSQVTAAVAASLAQSEGRKVYTAADTIDFTLTPNANEALSANTNGELWVYLRLHGP